MRTVIVKTGIGVLALITSVCFMSCKKQNAVQVPEVGLEFFCPESYKCENRSPSDGSGALASFFVPENATISFFSDSSIKEFEKGCRINSEEPELCAEDYTIQQLSDLLKATIQPRFPGQKIQRLGKERYLVSDNCETDDKYWYRKYDTLVNQILVRFSLNDLSEEQCSAKGKTTMDKIVSDISFKKK